MGNTGLAVSNISNGLDFFNGKGIVRNCSFLNCTYSIDSVSYEKELEIVNNEFIINENVNPYLLDFSYGKVFINSDNIGDYDAKDVLICGNRFDGDDTYFGVLIEQMSLAYNTITNCIGSARAKHFYLNEFIDCTNSIQGYNYDSLYIKNNRFIGGNYGINVDHANVEISGNYFEDCDLDTEFCDGIIFNNEVKNGEFNIPGDLDVYNNICYDNLNNYGLKAGYNPYCTNNISVNNRYSIWSATISYDNCIILHNEELTEFYVNGNPIFRNCIIDFPLDPPLVDGGGNVIVDEEQAQLIFDDIDNGNFHLTEGSIAIDAGFDTLGYYYPFDIANSVRVWDGDGDGNAIIDIGAYEYGAPQLGKICGYITETFSGNPVDYVKILADNEPGEFNFADSSGYFEISLPEGTYDLYAERVFYEDNIIYTVTVNNEEITEIEFNMTYNDPVVGIEDNEVHSVSGMNLGNYPNPFNPSTTISFTAKNAIDAKVEIKKR